MINYKWVEINTISKDDLKSFCTSDREIEFCWWVCSDIGESSWCYDQIVNLVSLSKGGASDEWRGNSHQIKFTQSKVIIAQPIKNHSSEFTLLEFEGYLKAWHEECVKRGIVFK